MGRGHDSALVGIGLACGGASPAVGAAGWAGGLDRRGRSEWAEGPAVRSRPPGQREERAGRQPWPGAAGEIGEGDEGSIDIPKVFAMTGYYVDYDVHTHPKQLTN